MSDPNQPLQPPPGDFVEATDAFGRRVRLGRDDYRKRVLPDLLKAHGNDPAQLTAVIMQGLQHGFAKDLVQAANRLAALDPEPERGLSVLSVVQRDAGDLDAAQFTLDELQQKRPDSAAARVGKAMLAQQRGDRARAEELLWEALQLDPNHPDAVHGYLQVRLAVVGDDGHRAELDRLASLPNAWRAGLWRARLDLQQGKVDDAVAAYRQLLDGEDSARDALLMAATDLANAGKHELIGELVAPRFVPGRDHPQIGLAVLHQLAASKQHRQGAELLHRMHLHYGHVVAEQLRPFTAEFDRQRLAELPALTMPAEPRVGMFRLEWPAFCSALGDPRWLLPNKAEGHKQVLFVALAIEGQSEGVHAGPEEDFGRLTRAVPMFLAEHVWLTTPHRGTALLPLTEPGGWAVMGRPWPEDQIAAQLGDDERGSALLVTGMLRIDGAERRIDLWVYDPTTRQRIGHAATSGPATEFGRMLLQLLTELWPLLGGETGYRPAVGDEAFWHRYADGLGQHAALVVTRAGAMPRDRLYGERYIAQWLQAAALQEPRWQPGFWLYASALCLLQELGSNVPQEHARVVGELFRQSPPQSPFARLALLPLRAVGLEAYWQARRDEIVQAAGGDPGYTAWLERAESAK
ncbi:MAG: hypothetical protein KDE27_20625 [Planctomycetes bacterium]|nr:hypothetical protein [Planctomycetota bacterium]